jgi:hypothetical protein
MADVDFRGSKIGFVLNNSIDLIQLTTCNHTVTIHFNQLEEIYHIAKTRKDAKEKPTPVYRETPKIKESPENAAM